MASSLHDARPPLRLSTLRQRLAMSTFVWAGGTLGSVILNSGANILGFAASALLVRLLLPSGFGLYSYAVTIATMLSIPGQFGIPVVVTREVAAGEALGRWDLARGVVRWAYQCIAISSMAIAAVVGVILVLAGTGGSNEQLITYLIALTLVPLFALDALRGGVLTGLRHVVLGRLPPVLRRLLLVIPLIVILPVDRALVRTPVRAMFITAVAAALAFAIGGWILRRVRPPELRSARPTSAARSWTRSSIPIGLTQGLQLLFADASIVLLGLFVSKTVVGQYRVATLVASVTILGLQAIGMTLAPYFARSIATADRQSLQRFLTHSSRIALIPALLLLVAYAVFGRWFLTVFFGPDYRAAYVPLVILTAGQAVNALTGSVGTLLNMANHSRDAMYAVAAGAAVGVVLNLALAPTMGMNGAAIATTLAITVWNGVLCQRAWTQLALVPGPLAARIQSRDDGNHP